MKFMQKFGILLTSLSLCVVTFAHSAGIQDHFKKIDKKTKGHSMPGIDFVYVINLDKRPERFQRTKDALAAYGINPFRFSAVNGWELSFKAIDELGTNYHPGDHYGPICTVYRHEGDQEYQSFEVMKEPGVAYYSHSLSRGAIGCLLSHLSCLQDAYDSGYKTVWIMEDDIRICQDPNKLTKLVKDLYRRAPDWDIFFTDNEIKDANGNPMPCYDTRPRANYNAPSVEYLRSQRRLLTPEITKIGMRFGSASMIISRSGMRKLLDFFKTYKLYFPYDIDYFMPRNIQIYQCTKDIVSNIYGGDSDNARPGYLDEEKKKEKKS